MVVVRNSSVGVPATISHGPGGGGGRGGGEEEEEERGRGGRNSSVSVPATISHLVVVAEVGRW